MPNESTTSTVPLEAPFNTEAASPAPISSKPPNPAVIRAIIARVVPSPLKAVAADTPRNNTSSVNAIVSRSPCFSPAAKRTQPSRWLRVRCLTV